MYERVEIRLCTVNVEEIHVSGERGFGAPTSSGGVVKVICAFDCVVMVRFVRLIVWSW